MRDLDLEIERVKKLPDEARKVIIGFYHSLANLDQLSERRQYFYVIKVRKLHETVGIIPLNEDSVMNAMAWVREQGYEKWTVTGYQQALTKFWEYLNSEKPQGTVKKLLTAKRDKNHKLTDKDMVTKAEIDQIVNGCTNSRDKALFTVLYDSGAKHGELIDMTNKDVEYDRYGAVLSIPITGKTGFRHVRVIGSSVAYLREWQNDHPHRNDPNAPLFCILEGTHYGEKMDYANTYKALKLTLKRAGIKRRIYPHLLRHTRATILSTSLTEIPLENQMGWVHGSQMTRVYVHENRKDTDRAVLKAYGVEVEEEGDVIQQDKPVKCPRCFEVNDPKARFCWKCGEALNMKEAERFHQKEMETVSALTNTELIPESEKALLNALSPDAMGEVLLVYLRKLKQEGKLEELAKNL
jgi:integrase